MNRINDNYIVQNNIVERYLQGKLTAEETIEFEEYIIDKPEWIERLEMESVLVDNLPGAFEKARQNVKSDTVEAVPWWQKPVASYVGVFTLGALCTLVFDRADHSHGSQALNLGRVDLVEVSPLRSIPAQAKADATYSLSNDADHIMLLLQPSQVEGESELVTILRHSSDEEIFKQIVQLNASGDFTVTLNKRQLKPGLYDVKFGVDDTNTMTISLL